MSDQPQTFEEWWEGNKTNLRPWAVVEDAARAAWDAAIAGQQAIFAEDLPRVPTQPISTETVTVYKVDLDYTHAQLAEAKAEIEREHELGKHFEAIAYENIEKLARYEAVVKVAREVSPLLDVIVNAVDWPEKERFRIAKELRAALAVLDE